MGKRKRGFNWKAREQNETIIDRGSEKKIKLDDSSIHPSEEGYDDCNTLVLPSKKRKTKQKTSQIQSQVKPLSKKERKRLEKVLQVKAKKAKRAEILESLSKVQASNDEMKYFVSVAEMQSGKTHKKDIESIHEEKKSDKSVNIVTGSNKKKDRKWNLKEESDDSIDTSDMSTDDDDEDDDTDDDDSLENDSGVEEVQQVEVPTKKNEVDTCVKVSSPKKTSNDDKIVLRPTVHVPLKREDTIQAARLKLPILGEEQVIMEAINENQVTIICGETGSGKTTQVPQFLYEAGYAQEGVLIGVTEPRRVAAISMSHRVAKEMNLTTRKVSYQIRYEGNVTDETKIKFMTDGVLLKEVQKDFLLSKYSVIIIDEAHERSVFTDILIGLLSRIVPLRNKKGNPLKLIIMSATLRVEDFTNNARLFKVTPPVIKVDSRQFPVTIHFNKRTPDNYLDEAYKKICKIHSKLPEGGILVFVTGQQEVHTLCRKLKQAFPEKVTSQGNKDTKDDGEDGKTKRRRKRKRKDSTDKKHVQENLPNINLDSYSVAPVDEEAQGEADEDSDFNEEDTAEEDNPSLDPDCHGCSEPLYVLPLYSMLSNERQAKVFSKTPEGCRLCVVATNVAETSLTIPNIRYVVDTGKVKTKFYDKVTGVSTFRITWTSQAAANQRSGRAGRVGPGHSYRLYSSAVFNDEFAKFSPAEITHRPVDDLVLQMKDMNIDKVANFPYPTPPETAQIKAAERLLVSLGALLPPKENTENSGMITPAGRAMASFPVAPRYAKMLSLGQQHGLMPYVVAIVSALSVQEVFIELHLPPEDSGEREEFRQKMIFMKQVQKRWAGSGNSELLGDLMVLLKAVGSCEYEGCTPEFCQKHGIRYKAMVEVRKLRAQLTNTVNMVLPEAQLCIDPKLDPPNDLQCKLLRQIVLAGLADHVARKCPEPTPGTAEEDKKKLKYAYQCVELDEPVYIHPSSILYRQNPEYIVYQSIEETSRLYMKGLVAIEPEWFPTFAPFYCTFSKPLDDPAPEYNNKHGQVMCHMTSTFGRCSWAVPAVCLEYPKNLEKYKWFGRFVLEGKVVAKLKKYTNSLLSNPSTMVKLWAKLQPRTEKLLKSLIAEEVDSHDTLMKIWKTKPKYLLNAYLEWIPESLHQEVTELWPPVKR